MSVVIIILSGEVFIAESSAYAYYDQKYVS